MRDESPELLLEGHNTLGRSPPRVEKQCRAFNWAHGF